MRLNEILESGAVKLPWPTILNGKKLALSKLKDSEACLSKCRENPACASNCIAGEFTCEFGVSYFTRQLDENTFTIYGVRGSNNKAKVNSYTKKSLKGRSVTSEEVECWVEAIRQLIKRIEAIFLLRQAEMLDPLHDPIRIAKQIHTISNRLVQQSSHGSSFDDQINNASYELKTLVKAADLLSDSFDLLSIYFNPDAASFGEKTAVSLHGLLTKLVAIFRIDDGGLTKSTSKIYLSGNSYRNVFVYESFKLIPFALLSNAVKYSLSGKIQVTIEDRRPVIEVAVESVGPYIEENEKAEIFRKGGRGQWAVKLIDGRGVGLYLAAIIAKAHDIQLKVSSRKTGEVHDGIPLAVYRFYFEIRP
ncbi:MAG TPA: ATP-binding protein [Rhodocyclaceae bacterium]|nr:ATP-binding protein [Rhodocyclaceae bacterium]